MISEEEMETRRRLEVEVMCEKKRRRIYLPFIMESPIPPFELTCWECGNLIKLGRDGNRYYLEEANKITFDPPLVAVAHLVDKFNPEEISKMTPKRRSSISEKLGKIIEEELDSKEAEG